MPKEIIAAIIQSIAILVAVGLGFTVTRKTKKLDWHEEQAKEFLVCSRNYSKKVSEIIVSLFIFFTDSKLTGDQKTLLNKTMCEMIRELQLLQWEVKRHALSAQEAKEQFLKDEAELYAELSKMIGVSNAGAGGRLGFDHIQQLQNVFDEGARKLHTALCALI